MKFFKKDKRNDKWAYFELLKDVAPDRPKLKCAKCGRLIQPGEKYYLFKGLWVGKKKMKKGWHTWAVCRYCHKQGGNHV